MSVLITVEFQHQKQSSSHKNTLKVTTEQEVLQCLQLVDVKYCKAALAWFSHSSISQDLAQEAFQREERTNNNEKQAAACSTKHTGQPKSQLTKLNYQSVIPQRMPGLQKILFFFFFFLVTTSGLPDGIIISYS